jgi:tetratricopeptide (TPR) repeat protein
LSFNQSLGYALYGFGFLRKVKDAVNSVIQHIDSDLLLSYLYLLLGDSYWMTGYIQKAIKCLQKSKTIAADVLQLMDINSSRCLF